MAPITFAPLLLSALATLAAASECRPDSEHCDSFDLLRTDVAVVGEEAADMFSFEIPPNCDCTCTPTMSPTPAPTEEVDIKDDPHIRNLAQEAFAVNQPGEYTLLRVPQDRDQAAQLELRGTIARHNGSACKMYTTGVSLSGKWLGNKVVFVRPLQRSSAGSNAASGSELWPLSVLVSDQGSHEWPAAGLWKSFSSFKSASELERNGAFPDTFRIVPFRDEAFGEMKEAETFQFQVGQGEQKAKINVAQASHQALNVALQQVKRLAVSRIGGLLGTEEHDSNVEKLTRECRLERASQALPGSMSLLSTPAWMTETRPSVLYSWWH